MKLPPAASFLIVACAAAFTAHTSPTAFAEDLTVNAHMLLISGDQISARGAISVRNTGTLLGRIGRTADVTALNAYSTILEGTGIAGGGASTLAHSLTLRPSSIIELALSTAGERSSFACTGGTLSFKLDQQFALIGIAAGNQAGQLGISAGRVSKLPKPILILNESVY